MQHRVLGHQPQELLGQEPARHRPQPAAAAAAEHDGMELSFHAGILTARPLIVLHMRQ